MHRRETIKKLVLATGSLASLPGWAKNWEIDLLPENLHLFSADESHLLSSVVDTIIPAGADGVGGISVEVDTFLIKLFERCYEPEIQQDIKVQLAKLDVYADNLNGRSFSQCLQEERILILQKMESSEDDKEQDIFKLIKSETIRGFQTSKEVMTRYHKYRVVPGDYQGCVDVEPQ